MTKRKFSFDVTGRRMFASEMPIIDALEAKYGTATGKAAARVHVVIEESHSTKMAAVRRAIRQGHSRGSALFEVVDSIRSSDPVAKKSALEKYAGVVAIKSTKVPRSKSATKVALQKATEMSLGSGGKPKAKRTG